MQDNGLEYMKGSKISMDLKRIMYPRWKSNFFNFSRSKKQRIQSPTYFGEQDGIMYIES